MSLTTIRNSLEAMRVNLGGDESTPGTAAVYDLIPTLLELVKELEERTMPRPRVRCHLCTELFTPYYPYGNRSGPLETRVCGDCVDNMIDEAKAADRNERAEPAFDGD